MYDCVIVWIWRPKWPPFGGSDGQGPVLVPLLIRTLIEKPPFGGPDGQGLVLVPLLIRTLIESQHLVAQMARGRFRAAKIRSLNELDVAKIHPEAPLMHGAQARAPQSAIYPRQLRRDAPVRQQDHEGFTFSGCPC